MITWNTEWDVDTIGAAGKIVDSATGRTIVVRNRREYPLVARVFGWDPRKLQRCPSCGSADVAETRKGYECGECEEIFQPCDHPETDGTTDCPDCRVTADEFADVAGDWLDGQDGAVAEDPGYFAETPAQRVRRECKELFH